MAIAYCTGPCHVYVGFRDGNLNVVAETFYLGTCEDTPATLLRPEFEAVVNSVSGKKPYDLSFQGEDALTALDLTRYNATVLELVRGRTVPGITAVGTYSAGDLGALALTEGLAMSVWLQFPYALKPAFAANGMAAGYRFPFSVPVGPDDLGPMGTRARKERLVFHHVEAYAPASGGHLLYDHDMTGIPALPPN